MRSVVSWPTDSVIEMRVPMNVCCVLWNKRRGLNDSQHSTRTIALILAIGGALFWHKCSRLNSSGKWLNLQMQYIYIWELFYLPKGFVILSIQAYILHSTTALSSRVGDLISFCCSFTFTNRCYDWTVKREAKHWWIHRSVTLLFPSINMASCTVEHMTGSLSCFSLLLLSEPRCKDCLCLWYH